MRSRLLPAALPIAALLLAACAAPPADAAPLKWEKSFEAALARAKAQGKPVMIDFWAEWCGYCHTLDETTYKDPRVVALSRQFVSVKIDTEGRQAEVDVAVRYLVSSLPTILFVSPDGRPLMRLNGYVPPAPFVKALEEMNRRAAPVVAWEKALAADPQNVEALVGLGLHQFTEIANILQRDARQRVPKKMFTDVETLLTKAYGADKARGGADRKRVRTSLGMLNGFVGRFEKSEKLLNESLAVKPGSKEDARAYLGLGEVYLMQDKRAEAVAAFKKVTTRYPDTDEARMVAQYLESLN